MSNELTTRGSEEPGLEVGAAPPGSIRRLGSRIGLAVITILDLLALEDITTAGAWMPEIGFVIVSVPALITLAYFAFRQDPADLQLPDADSHPRIAP